MDKKLLRATRYADKLKAIPASACESGFSPKRRPRTTIPIPAQVELELDGAVVASQAVTLEPGIQTVTLPASDGPLPSGWHTVRVRMNASGLSSVVETEFVYGALGLIWS